MVTPALMYGSETWKDMMNKIYKKCKRMMQVIGIRNDVHSVEERVQEYRRKWKDHTDGMGESRREATKVERKKEVMMEDLAKERCSCDVKSKKDEEEQIKNL